MAFVLQISLVFVIDLYLKYLVLNRVHSKQNYPFQRIVRTKLKQISLFSNTDSVNAMEFFKNSSKLFDFLSTF